MHRTRSLSRRFVIGAAALALIGLAGCSDQSEGELLRSAQTHIENKDGPAAVLELKVLLQANPGSAQGRFMLGNLLFSRGEMSAAEAELRRALEAGHPAAAVLPQLAAAMLAQGKARLLLDEFKKADLPAGQANAEFKTHLAAATAAIGDLPGATALLDEAQRQATDTSVVELQRARLLVMAGNVPDALARVQTLTAREPNNAKALALKGDLLAKLGAGNPTRLDEAISVWRQSLAIKPDDVFVHSAIIATLMARQDWSGATAQWNDFKQQAPQSRQVLYFEALLAEQRGDPKRVRELAQGLLRSAPNSLQLLMLAGRAELRLGGLAQASSHFAKAMQAAPGAPEPRESLAQVQLRAGQVNLALGTLKPLVEPASRRTQALVMAAQARLVLGENAAAEALLMRAAQVSPTDSRVRTAAAIAQLAKVGGSDAAAMGELQAVAAADKEPIADLALITARLQRGQWAEALKGVDALQSKMPEDPQPHYFRARIALQRGDNTGARESFTKALAKNPDYLPALIGLTTLDMLDKKPADAKARLEAALQRNDKNTAAWVALADINASNNGPVEEGIRLLEAGIKADPADPSPRTRLIDLLLSNNQLKAAHAAAQSAVTTLPADASLLDRLGRIQLLSGEPLQAVATFGKLAALQPKSTYPLLRLADAHAAAKDPARSAASVRAALALAPDDPAALRGAAALNLAERNPAQALALARKLQARDKRGGLILEAEIEIQQSRWAAAVAAYRRALALAPTADITLRLHDTLLVDGKGAEAEQLAVAWRKQHPDDLAFVMELAGKEMSRRRLAQAEALYREVLARKPGHLLALNNLAYALVNQRKPGGVALAEQAIKQVPDSAPFHDTLAFCLAAEKQWSRAIESQTRAVELAPDVPPYRLQLAKLHWQAGDKDAASTQLDFLEKLGPGFHRQAEVRSLRKAISG